MVNMPISGQKIKKTKGSGFLMFSEGIDMENWLEMSFEKKN